MYAFISAAESLPLLSVSTFSKADSKPASDLSMPSPNTAWKPAATPSVLNVTSRPVPMALPVGATIFWSTKVAPFSNPVPTALVPSTTAVPTTLAPPTVAARIFSLACFMIPLGGSGGDSGAAGAGGGGSGACCFA